MAGGKEMKKTCTFQDIKNMLIECANVNDEITPDSVLKTDLGIDSIYAVEMILALEEKDYKVIQTENMVMEFKLK